MPGLRGLTMPEELARADRLESLADRAAMLALGLRDCDPTRDGLAPLVVMARSLTTELTALREDA